MRFLRMVIVSFMDIVIALGRSTFSNGQPSMNCTLCHFEHLTVTIVKGLLSAPPTKPPMITMLSEQHLAFL